MNSIIETLRKTSSPTIFIICISSVIAGCAAAAVHGNMTPLPASVFLLFALSAQLTVNFGHRLNDEHYTLGENIDDRISDCGLTGGQTETVLREATGGMLMLTVMLGLTLSAMGGWWMFLNLVVFGLLIALYAFGQTPLSRTAWAPLITFFIYGPVGVTACCLVQAQHQTMHPTDLQDLVPAILIGCGVGLLAANALILHNYTCYRNDLHNGKMSLPVVMGRKFCRRAMVVSSALSVPVFGLAGVLCRHTQTVPLLVAPVLGFAATCLLTGRMRRLPYRKLRDQQWIGNCIMLGVALVTLIIVITTGASNETNTQVFPD